MTPKQEVIELTKKLVEFKSVKDNPEELKRIVDFVADYLKGCGEIKKIELNGKPLLPPIRRPQIQTSYSQDTWMLSKLKQISSHRKSKERRCLEGGLQT